MLIATGLAFLFFHFVRDNSANIALIYILALILISRHTTGYLYDILSALFCVIFINGCFTYPFFEVNFTLSGYPITFICMLIITITTSAMTTRLKKQDEIIAERERKLNEVEKERICANLLRAVSHDLRFHPYLYTRIYPDDPYGSSPDRADPNQSSEECSRAFREYRTCRINHYRKRTCRHIPRSELWERH